LYQESKTSCYKMSAYHFIIICLMSLMYVTCRILLWNKLNSFASTNKLIYLFSCYILFPWMNINAYIYVYQLSLSLTISFLPKPYLMVSITVLLPWYCNGVFSLTTERTWMRPVCAVCRYKGHVVRIWTWHTLKIYFPYDLFNIICTEKMFKIKVADINPLALYDVFSWCILWCWENQMSPKFVGLEHAK
jgi:hypothetical protein